MGGREGNRGRSGHSTCAQNGGAGRLSLSRSGVTPSRPVNTRPPTRIERSARRAPRTLGCRPPHAPARCPLAAACHTSFWASLSLEWKRGSHVRALRLPSSWQPASPRCTVTLHRTMMRRSAIGERPSSARQRQKAMWRASASNMGETGGKAARKPSCGGPLRHPPTVHGPDVRAHSCRPPPASPSRLLGDPGPSWARFGRARRSFGDARHPVPWALPIGSHNRQAVACERAPPRSHRPRPPWAPQERPWPRYWKKMLARSLDAAATEMRSFVRSSCSLRSRA